MISKKVLPSSSVKLTACDMLVGSMKSQADNWSQEGYFSAPQSRAYK